MKSLLIIFFITFVVGVTANLKEKFHWKELDFDWPNETLKQEAIDSGEYIAENCLPMSLDRWNNKLFIAVPRYLPGVPSTLNYIDLNSKDISPKLIPYPSWEANKFQKGKEDCHLKANFTIISTSRIQADNCDRLWVIDDEQAQCSITYQIGILIFDLKEDKLIRRVSVKLNAGANIPFLGTITIDSDRKDCGNAYAYVTHSYDKSVIVYSFHDNESYKVKHDYFHSDLEDHFFIVGGVDFFMPYEIFGMAIVPKKCDSNKYVYFHALASNKEFRVSNRILKNKTLATNSSSHDKFKYVGDRGWNGHSTAEAYDKRTGVVFYTLLKKNAVGCWNVKKPYIPSNQGVVDSNSRTLKFPIDLKIDSESTIWVLSNRMISSFFTQGYPADINYRVLIGNSSELIKGSPCDL